LTDATQKILSASVCVFSLTPRFSAVSAAASHPNRFSGFIIDPKPLKRLRTLC
jgi:hypothetical protein